MSTFERVVGQERAVAQLVAAARQPVHAYLFVGPPGAGKRAAALGFAAALLCPNGGDGTCPTCHQVLSSGHIDVEVVERVGPYITTKQAEEVVLSAARSPVAGRRKVLILVDFHLVERAGPMLLKTIEEPPASTVFIVLAEHVPPELVTIASRCVRVEFPPLGASVLTSALVSSGISPDVAATAAAAAGGNLDRARLLAADPEVVARHAAWEAVPTRLDGTGATAAILVTELLDLVQRAGAAGLADAQAAEWKALEERAALTGERVTGRKEIEDRHKREQRRLRTDELRAGLAVLAGAYRDRALEASSPRSRAAALASAKAVHDAGEALVRNPNEALLLQSLMLRLSN